MLVTFSDVCIYVITFSPGSAPEKTILGQSLTSEGPVPLN